MVSKRKFDKCRDNCIAAGIDVAHNLLICPLCWERKAFEDFSSEHIIPKKAGGKKTTLTCKKCNNDDGSSLDSQLSKFQKMSDFSLTNDMKARMIIDNVDVGMNGYYEDGFQIQIVEANSNPVNLNVMTKKILMDPRFDITVPFDGNRFQLALLRSAYLTMFEEFGYEYAQHENIQTLRRRIRDRLRVSVGFEFRDVKLPTDIVRCNWNRIDSFIVFMSLHNKKTTSHFGVFLPCSTGTLDEFFSLVDEFRQEISGKGKPSIGKTKRSNRLRSND